MDDNTLDNVFEGSGYNCEYERKRGPHKGTICGKFAPAIIENMRVCTRHYNSISRKLGLS